MKDNSTPPETPEIKPATPEELATANKHRKLLITIVAVFVLLPLVLATLRIMGIL